MSGPLVYEMLFRGDASSAKAAAAEAQAATGALAAQTQQATTATAAETAAVIANAEARQRAAQAATAHAQAEQAARSVMTASAGIPAAGAASAYTANVMANMNDVLVMAAAGQNPMMLMMQQGTQITQAFGQMRASGLSLGTALRGAFAGMLNPMSLATMAVIGFGTAAVQWLMDTGEEAQTLDEALGKLESSAKAVKSALKEARRGSDDLVEDFGSGARAARELNLALLGLARMEAALEAKKAITAVSESIEDMHSWLNFGVVDSRTLEKQFNLTARGASEVSAAIQKFQFAISFDEKVAAAKGIAEALNRAQYNAEGATEEAIGFGIAVGETARAAFTLEETTAQEKALLEAIAKSGIDAPFETAAEKAKRLADETRAIKSLTDDVMKVLKETRAPYDLEADLKRTREIGEATLKYGSESLEVKRLKVAAERQDFEAQVRTMNITDQHRQKLLELWDAAKGLKSVDPFGTLAAGQDYLRTQGESLAKTQLELSLIGQTEAARRRVLALFEAEQQIRTMGLDPAGDQAALIRQNAVAGAEAEATLDRVRDAWDTVQSAGEAAIDGIFDALKKGDVEGALESLASEIGAMFEELAILNPLKNAIFGADYATMADVGGLRGIWDRLTGNAAPLQIAGVSSQSVGAMTVTAAQVIVNGGLGGVGGLGAANMNGPIGGGLTGSADVQSQVWQFFAAKGLAPHQIAGIMGNVSRESLFNPFSVGDAGQAFGLFQHNDRKGKLFDFIGGKGNLGNVNAQLEFAWHELMTSESGPMRRLLASTNVRDATAAFAGFERPSGYTLANPMGADGWSQRLGAAEQAMAKFGTTTMTATGQLGSMGNGFDKFGQALGSALQGGAADGSGGNLFGTLISAILGGLGIPGFAGGGQHSGGLRIVGENGPELEYTGPSTIVPADLTRRILNGGAATQNASQIDARPIINIVNQSSAKVSADVQETTDERGQRRFDLVMSDVVAAGVAAQGGKARRSMRDIYGLQPTGIAR